MNRRLTKSVRTDIMKAGFGQLYSQLICFTVTFKLTSTVFTLRVPYNDMPEHTRHIQWYFGTTTMKVKINRNNRMMRAERNWIRSKKYWIVQKNNQRRTDSLWMSCLFSRKADSVHWLLLSLYVIRSTFWK